MYRKLSKGQRQAITGSRDRAAFRERRNEGGRLRVQRVCAGLAGTALTSPVGGSRREGCEEGAGRSGGAGEGVVGRGRCVGEVTPEACGENQEAGCEATERFGGKTRDRPGGDKGAGLRGRAAGRAAPAAGLGAGLAETSDGPLACV